MRIARHSMRIRKKKIKEDEKDEEIEEAEGESYNNKVMNFQLQLMQLFSTNILIQKKDLKIAA